MKHHNHRVSRIENPTLAHFRHFSSLFTPSPLYICRERSTNQLLFMQNKPNFRKSQMNVSIFLTKEYENKRDWTLGQNKPNSNPIQTQSYPICRMPKMDVNSILTKDYERNDIFAVPENKAKTKPIQSQYKPKTNPIKPKTKPKQTQPVVSLPALLVLSLPKGARPKGRTYFKRDTLLLCGALLSPIIQR